MSRFIRGFTLIEIIVSVVIIMTITGIGVAGYSNFNTTQRVKQAALTLRNNLHLAQTKATSASTSSSPSLCNGDPTVDMLLGYQVSFQSDSYEMVALCSNGPVESTRTPPITLPSGISFNPLPSSILFKALSQGIDTNTNIILFLNGDTRYQVSVDVGGTISGPIKLPPL